ncbi:4-hydroxythreonine-4-phosphate dehydrogenase PdxA [Coxiella endosymbiont of Amblyomma americanum]|uniref:4-hydroxythreonine-4-phosphate dehydrogenase PdxA n=1 Tax=Coxiella endosymbiont of Amblyomma americanum TaxID=325775 RepID=UPI0005808FF9|nr:4-hydroxythreonine-4-phosphate dehydrogenase PdxA [Coxiella endosymbiont of Amblyomma americanum]AJC50365.1 4-hydroxythreonine-4-phosphate dehydrogenase [Coxiella endosymbiont of Amblyomma americanum]
MTTLPIAITPGEPAGIGPDIVIKLLQHKLPTSLVIVADRTLLTERAKVLGLKIPNNVTIHHIPLKVRSIIGKPTYDNAEYVIETLLTAANGCLNGNFRALVTGPISKVVINNAGIPFTGHTEWLAAHAHIKQTVMLFVANALKVALYTTHIPLSHVSTLIKKSSLERCIRLLHSGLKKYFSIKTPIIALCGLNPHAGEKGLLGKEELSTIIPVIQSLNNQEDFSLIGPFPADTAFTPQAIKNCDAILAMYHDQGLTPIKALKFNCIVNMTLGLPYIRISVDHGTAFDLAGTGLADENSLIEAITLAIKIT